MVSQHASGAPTPRCPATPYPTGAPENPAGTAPTRTVHPRQPRCIRRRLLLATKHQNVLFTFAKSRSSARAIPQEELDGSRPAVAQPNPDHLRRRALEHAPVGKVRVLGNHGQTASLVYSQAASSPAPPKPASSTCSDSRRGSASLPMQLHLIGNSHSSREALVSHARRVYRAQRECCQAPEPATHTFSSHIRLHSHSALFVTMEEATSRTGA